jgi:hypothetical protein
MLDPRDELPQLICATKSKHSTGEVKSSGGYLRGMVEVAQAGELHLDRSFYGRLSEKVGAHR